MKNKKILIPIAFIVIFLLGGEFAKRSIFPYGKGLRSLLPEFLHLYHQEIPFCPRLKHFTKKYEFFSNKKIDNIFIGDSVVEDAWSERLFNLNYTLLAVGGSTIDCSKLITEYIKKIEPKNIIIYLGGNDADGQSNYSSEIALEYYVKFLNELENIKSISKIYLIGINYGDPKRRSSDYVKSLNNFFGRSDNGKKIFYIESFEELDFRKKNFSQLSYDGEHLKYLGYKKWFKYLSKKIDNFIIK